MPHDETDDQAVDKADGPSQLRIALNITLLVAVAALVLDNLRSVTIGFVVGEAKMPLAVLIVLVWALGVTGGWVGSKLATRNRD